MFILDATLATGEYLLIIVPSMIIGVILTNLLYNLGLMERIAILTRPITSFGNLNELCGLSFIYAFGSPAAANTMLMDQFKKGNIPKRQLYVGALINSFPAFLMRWRIIFPIVIPLLGMYGIIYFCILLCVSIIKTALILIVGKIILQRNEKPSQHDCSNEYMGLRSALKASIRQSKKTVSRILKITLPVTWFVFCLYELGLFDHITQWLTTKTVQLPIPAQGIPVIVAKFANYIIAYTVAANLFAQKLLTGKEIITVLLMGDILSHFTAMRYQIPYYLGVFGARIGIKVLLISSLLWIGLILSAITLLIII